MNFTGFPPSDKSFAGVQEDVLDRISRLERRKRGGGDGGTTVLAPAFMTPTSVTGGSFDPQTGRITLTPGATGVGVHGVFTSQYRAYKIIFGWYTGTANGLVIRLGQGLVQEQAAVYEYAYSANSGATPTGNEVNAATFWGLASVANPGHHGEITVFEPMTTEYTNNQKRYVASCSAYGNSTGVFGGIIGGRDTTPYDSFWIQNSGPGPGVTATSGSWVMVVPIPTSQVPSGVGGGGSAHLAGDVWQIGDGSVPPPGTLLCDGRAVSRTTYAELFARIGTKYGSGDGSTTFNLPNLNGKTVDQTSGSVSRVALDGIFSTLSSGTGNVGPDFWDVYYSLDMPGTSGNELRTRFRSGGSDVTAASYFHTRDGFSGANLQSVVGPTDYFEPAWGNVQNVSGVLRVYRAGKPGDWTNFEGTSEARGSVFTQGAVQVGGSLQQASDIDGIVFYTQGGGYTIGTVAAVPAGGSLVPSVIAYTAGGGGSTPGIVGNKGTTADRNAAYPLPANTSQQVALHNLKIQWQNTETGWTEQYYAPSNLAGVNAPGLIVDAAAPSGYPAGWYPIAGSHLIATFIKNNGFQAVAGGVQTAPTLSVVLNNTQSKFTAFGASGIIPSIAGFYDMSYSVYFSGAAAMAYVNGFISYVGGAEIVSQRIPANNVDMQVQGAVQSVRVPAGQGIQLLAMPAAAHNVYGDGTSRRTFLTLSYAGPPLVGI